MEAFIGWLREIQIDVPPAGALGKATSYALNLEQELKVFLEDARVPIDNNAVERAIRPVVVGRKNWLFAGSEQGGAAPPAPCRAASRPVEGLSGA